MTLGEDAGLVGGPSLDVIALEQALHELSSLDSNKAQVVELRFFGGLSVEETAEIVGTSPATVKREWRMARAWLQRRLTHGTSAFS